MMTSGIAAALDRALRDAKVPVEVVSIGVNRKPVDDKSGWSMRLAADATRQQSHAAQAIIDAFNPETVKAENRRDFEMAMDRLTPPERRTLQAARSQDANLDRWFWRAATRASINPNDPKVKTALASVVAAGLFSEARLAALFAATVG